jgi:NAD(P)-dependent dehydrogenase (short-subunit alcohol dehydrogenase family)
MATEKELDMETKTALITGSGRRRVGYSVAKHLARRGFNIGIHYHRSERSAAENVQELLSCGVDADKFQADVTNETEVRQLVAHVVDRFSSLDALVTTSSIWKSVPLPEISANHVLESKPLNSCSRIR